MSTNDGGPAFPHQYDHVLYFADDPTKPAQTIKGVWTGGMSLRDYFAAKALPALITAAAIANNPVPDDRIAELSYGMADAMLAARSKP